MPFKKGQSGNPNGRKQGSLNRATLLKEERRSIFEAQISQEWERIIKKLPPTYIADQYLGKAPDRLEVDATVKGTLTAELLEIAEEELRKRKINAQAKDLSAPTLPPEDKGDVLL